tara:strand:- start:447 stop:944 length:498 start_codon:yes stop_codon:yes gene_type:complete
MIKKGIVGSVQSNGTWEGKYGMMYKYEVTIGEDVGEYSSKSENQNKFVVGQEAEYEYIGGQYPKIKPVSTFQPNSGGGFKGGNDSDRQMMIVKQSSLNRAVDMVIGDKLAMKDVLTTAQKFTDWVMSSETTTQQPTQKATPKPQPAKQVEAFATNVGDADGDLPF